MRMSSSADRSLIPVRRTEPKGVRLRFAAGRYEAAQRRRGRGHLGKGVRVRTEQESPFREPGAGGATSGKASGEPRVVWRSPGDKGR